MTAIGTVIDDKYEILKEIGRGGMSVVYLSMDKRLNKQWAVKEIRKQGNGKNDEIIVNSLLSEANLMKRLDHPALPRIVDIIDNGETIYVVMDYIEGESLDRILKEYGPQSEESVVDWAKQLCDALSYLHSQKPPIIYRDMKPANVMLKPEGNVKIIDFGIAREYKEQSLSDTTVLGTKGYAPPEQYSGQTDCRSDIYALGMTMHHLLTGKDPRGGDVYHSVRQWNPGISEGVEAIIDRCVEPAPENRYQNCADLLYDLNHPELITKGYKRKQKNKLFAFIGAVALCVLTLASGVITKQIAVKLNNNEYENLIDTGSLVNYEERVENYLDAISIYPERPDAYIKLLEAYGEDEEFSQKEQETFVALYENNSKVFDAADPGTAELNYQAGMLYFTYYMNGTDSTSDDERMKRAYGFFESNHLRYDEISGDFEYMEMSECYYYICLFNKKYISKGTMDEPTKEEYEDILDKIQNSVEILDNSDKSRFYDHLSFYYSVFKLIYDQRANLAALHVDKATVLEVFDDVYSAASGINATKDHSKKLRDKMDEHYSEYREAIERAYLNREVRD